MLRCCAHRTDARAHAKIYARLAEGKGGRAAAIVHALQFEGAERRARIASLAGQHAFYGPVHMLLADEYAPNGSAAKPSASGVRNRRPCRSFLEAERSGTLSQHFLDHSVLAQWLDRARSRQQALDQFLKTAKLEPTAQFILSNSGWLANVWVPEPATRISWRANEKGEFRATGDTAFIDQRTGKPSPNLSFELPRDTPESTIELRYEDANGEMRGPFRVRFEPRAEIVKSQRDLLQRFSNNWLSFGDGGAQAKLVYSRSSPPIAAPSRRWFWCSMIRRCRCSCACRPATSRTRSTACRLSPVHVDARSAKSSPSRSPLRTGQ